MHIRAISSRDSDPPDRAISSKLAGAGLSLPDLRQWAEGWLLDCEIRQHSAQTLKNRRYLLDKLFWFHREREYSACNAATLRQFLHYAGAANPEGRFGCPDATEKLKPGTVATFHRILTALFNWIVEQDGLAASPMAKIAAPIDRPDQIQPFSQEQVDALLQAAKKSEQPRRNEALLLLFLDTGMRVSELCGLRFCDVDMIAKRLRVLGKGAKQRSIPFGKAAARALWLYLHQNGCREDDPVFRAEGGWHSGDAMTRSGVEQLIRKLGRAAHIQNVRCSPHTLRHTFAVMFLRNGGNQFSLMEILGHTDLKMTARYVALAQADVEAQHRQYSPVDRMHRSKGRKA